MLAGPDGHQPPAALEEHHARREDADAFDRFAAFIGHAAGDGAHAREREIDLVEDLTVRELHGPADLAWPPLPVIEPEVSAARHRDAVPRRRQLLELVAAVEVGAGRALRLGAELGCPNGDACPAQGLATLTGDDATFEDGRALYILPLGVAGRRGPVCRGLNRYVMSLAGRPRRSSQWRGTGPGQQPRSRSHVGSCWRSS